VSKQQLGECATMWAIAEGKEAKKTSFRHTFHFFIT